MMVVHDDVMPKMGNINAVGKQLKEYVAANKETLDSGSLERISVVQFALQKADDGMMSWMNGLKQLPALRKELNHEAIMLYLQEQTKIIDSVKGAMLSSIEKGTALMNELNSQ